MSDRPKAPSLPATDASTTAGSRYEQVAPSDVLRRIGATEYRCTHECLVALSLTGRFVNDVPAPELFGEGDPAAVADVEPDDGSDIEVAPESWAQLACPDWTL